MNARLRTLALALTLAAAPAAAQPREDARRSYQEGMAAFDARAFDTALARFQHAYVLTQRPELLVNVAATLQRLGRRADAAQTYRRYLALAPAAPDRAAIEGRIATLEAPVPAAAPRVDVAPPAAVVREPTARAPAPPVWPWVLVGGGAMFAAAGAVLLVLPGDPGADRSIVSEQAYVDAVARRQAFMVAGGVALGVGVVAVVGGVVGLALRRRGEGRAAWTLDGRVVAGGGVLGVAGGF